MTNLDELLNRKAREYCEAINEYDKKSNIYRLRTMTIALRALRDVYAQVPPDPPATITDPDNWDPA